MFENVVALLDVDGTLSSTPTTPINSAHINSTLLEVLKKNKVRHVYLFTDMVFETSVMKHRMELIDYLEQQGFIVHGVITPNDLIWAPVENKDLTFGVLLEQQRPGRGFEDAKKQLQEKGYVSPSIKKRSYRIARELVPSYVKNWDVGHSKGLVFDLFLYHMPEWVTGIVVVDDQESVIKSVKVIHRKCSQDQQSKRQIPPLVTLQVLQMQNDNEQIYYEAALTSLSAKIQLANLPAKYSPAFDFGDMKKALLEIDDVKSTQISI